MVEKCVIYVTTVTPSDVGHGGVHRSYQILHELEQIVGPGQVRLFTKHQLLAEMEQKDDHDQRHLFRTGRRLKQWASHRAGTAKRILKNPYRLIQRTQFATGIHPSIRNYYELQVRNLGRAVCVMEHAEFADLIPINQKYKIPTISCTQNLDAFSQNQELLSSNLTAIGTGDIEGKQRAGIYAAIVDFANELQILAQCDERLFISKLETGLIGGLGLTARYYPYVPVGAIRSRLISIRQKRASTRQEPGLFILIGTAEHGPIKKSCEWLIHHARDHGLPEGVRIIVAGAGTDALLAPGESIPGIELKGWVKQEEMDELLARARAALVPQRFGFGVPTRLAELSCAGVPMVGDRHPTYAVDPPPGFHVVDTSWTNWYEKILELDHEDISVAENDYDNWEAAQLRPLGEVVNMMLG
jgi:glycosyltransferase involved in cell wall biosynthesis